ITGTKGEQTVPTVSRSRNNYQSLTAPGGTSKQVLARTRFSCVPVFVPTKAHLHQPSGQLVDCIRLWLYIAHRSLDLCPAMYCNKHCNKKDPCALPPRSRTCASRCAAQYLDAFLSSTHPLHLVFRNPSRQVFGGLGWSLVGPWICDYVARLLIWVIHRDDWPTGQIVL